MATVVTVTQSTSMLLFTTSTLAAGVVDQSQLASISAQVAGKAPIVSARPGGRTVWLGDSLTAGADDKVNQVFGVSVPTLACVVSGGRLQFVANAGVPGDTTAGMLARFDTDVTPFAPNIVPLLAGTNDAGNAAGFTAWTISMMAIIAKIRGISAVPVMCTLPPSSTASRHQVILQMNAWIRDYAIRQGITLVDYYKLLVDPATGNWKAGASSDGTHPLAPSTALMAALFSATVSPMVPPGSQMQPCDDVDPNNLVPGGCFTAGSGSALPPGFVDQAGLPAGSTLSYVTDAAVPGKMLTVSQAAAVGVRKVGITQYIGATTLSAAATAGSTSIVLAARADFGQTLFIGSGSTFEVVKIASSAGGGPQTETLASPLQYSHSSGENVIVGALPGDQVIFTAVITSDGGVPVSLNTFCAGAAYSPAPYANVSTAITRGLAYQRFVVPAGTTQITWNMQAGSGTGITSFGQFGVYNATRLGL